MSPAVRGRGAPVRAQTFWKTVVDDRVGFLDRVIGLLADHGIRYLFLGRELGGKPPELEKSLADEVVWRYLRSRPQFQEGLARLLQEARQARLALLCAEAEPGRCHRGLLLAPELEGLGAQVLHILADGRVVGHASLNLAAPPAQKRLF